MVSIVIPAYNCEKTIGKCLDSVICQTYKEIEIIVINDGSKDHTLEVIEEYSIKDKRIRVKTIENSGPGGARNAGIDMAQGDYLAFVDSDDIVYPDYVEKMVESRESNNADLVIFNMEMLYDYTKIEFNRTEVKDMDIFRLYEGKENIIKNMLSLMEQSWYINTLWCKMYKLDIIKKNNIRINEDIDMGEDFQFNLKYIDKIDSLYIDKEVVYKYFVVNSTLTGKFRDRMYEIRKISIDEFSKFVDKYKMDKNIIHYLYIKLLFAECMQMSEFKKYYTRKTRNQRIHELLDKDEIQVAKNEQKPQGIMQKVLHMCVKTNSIFVIYNVSKLLLFIKKHCPKIKRMSI